MVDITYAMPTCENHGIEQHAIPATIDRAIDRAIDKADDARGIGIDEGKAQRATGLSAENHDQRVLADYVMALIFFSTTRW